MGRNLLGQLEQLVMLAILQLDHEAHAISIRRLLAESADHHVSRGALYSTLDRLEAKGYARWEVDECTPERDGYSRRRFFLTNTGLAALQDSHRAYSHLSRDLTILEDNAL